VNGGAPLRPRDGGWNVVSASYLGFAEGHPVPMPMSTLEAERLPGLFAAAARRALAAGFEVIEIHAAHGYLLHQFLSPLTNRRGDGYGGPFDGRVRLVREVVGAVRGALPERIPLLLRLSATDWVEGGWTPEDTVALARLVKGQGVDLVDVSSGGLVPNATVPVGPGYQVPFSERVRREAGVATAAVGLITSARQAEAVVAEGKADLVLMGRELLRDPRFPLKAAAALGVDVPWPNQYLRAKT
jgi:2,4-dienoyl-CoA reductase-like NADH-dependent reductase (Old Yellow Enzyme family)